MPIERQEVYGEENALEEFMQEFEASNKLNGIRPQNVTDETIKHALMAFNRIGLATATDDVME